MPHNTQDKLVANYLESGNIDPEVLDALLMRETKVACYRASHELNLEKTQLELDQAKFDLERQKRKFTRKEKDKNARCSYIRAMCELQKADTNIVTSNTITFLDKNEQMQVAVSPTIEEVKSKAASLATAHGFVRGVKHETNFESSIVTVFLLISHVDGHSELFKGSTRYQLPSQLSLASEISGAISLVLKKLLMEAFCITFTPAEEVAELITCNDESSVVPADVAVADIQSSDEKDNVDENGVIREGDVEKIIRYIDDGGLNSKSVVASMKLTLKIPDLKGIRKDQLPDVYAHIDKLIKDKQNAKAQKKKLKSGAH